jgi:tetratricopeptide (TPR) repeat protein
MPRRFGADWNPFSTVFISGEWWYDRSENTFGYTLSEDATEWGDTTWEFPGPDEYAAIAAEREPGWTANAGEKAMHTALVSGDPYAIDLTAGQHPAYRAIADTLAGLLSLNTQRSYAGELLDRAIEADYEPKDDPFVRSYLPGAGIVVPIAPGVVVPLPLMRTAVALAAAELHQAAQEYTRAIGVLDPVEPTTHVTLSLAELLCAAGRYAEAIEMTAGVVNTDDVTALTMAYRAMAQREVGDVSAAAQTLEDVLGRDSRSDEVVGFARVVESSLAGSSV